MILILGAGFIGLSLYNHLKAGGYPVRLFSRNLPTDKKQNHFQGNINEIEKHEEIFSGVSTIIHAVHTTVPATSLDNELYDIESNVIPFVKLLKICQKKVIKNFIYISSGGTIFGKPADENAFLEISPTNPISSYGITKLANEKYLLLYKNSFSDKCVILRPSNIYGESQKLNKPQGLIGFLINAVKTKTKFQIWGDGNSKKDYLHISDFNNAVENIIKHKGKLDQNIYNLGSGNNYSINEIIAFFEKTFETKIKVEYDSPKSFDVQNIKLNSTLFKETFGWESKITMDNFIKEIYVKTKI